MQTSLTLGVDTRSLDSGRRAAALVQERDLSRHRAVLQGSFDLPITSRRENVLAAVGNLSLNLNSELEDLSDFGTLTTLGDSVSWEPVEPLDLAVTVTDEDGAPSMQQLGDPVLSPPMPGPSTSSAARRST